MTGVRDVTRALSAETSADWLATNQSSAQIVIVYPVGR